jgi:hypothetical protein
MKMKLNLCFSQTLKALLLIGLLAGPIMAIKTMALTEINVTWVPQDVYYDNNNNPYAYWNDPNNWSTGVVPGLMDTNSSDTTYGDYYAACFQDDASAIIPCLVTNDTQIGHLYLGYAGAGEVIVTNGASLEAGFEPGGQWTGVGFVAGPGTLFVAPGSSFSCGSHLWVGQGGANQLGVVIDDGGTISVPSGQLGAGWNGGTNYVYVTNNAHLYLGQFSPQILGYPYTLITSIGYLDIDTGSSVVVSNNNLLTYAFTFNQGPQLGQTVNLINCLVTNDQLIAYGGQGKISTAYNPTLNNSTITAIAPVNASTPVFSVQPTNTIASLGGTATFNALVSNVPVTYQWLFNGAALTDGNGISGAQTATLTIANVNASENGIYSVVATNSSVSTAFTLSTTASLSAESFNLFPVITINGINGDVYVVQYTTSLTPPVTWTPLSTNTVGAGPLQVVDTSSPLSLRRFYQVVQQ